MQVDVVELNHLGQRIPRDQRQGLPVFRGELSIERMWPHQNLDRAPVHAHLVPPRMEPLYNVKLQYWRGRNVVLAGMQRAPLPGRKAEGSFEQVWWCRLVLDVEGKR